MLLPAAVLVNDGEIRRAELITSKWKYRMEFSGPCGCLILVFPWISLASWQPLVGHTAAIALAA